jgi:hypothetical protein
MRVMQQIQYMKVGNASPGKMIGQVGKKQLSQIVKKNNDQFYWESSIINSQRPSQLPREQTAICKSDALVIEIEQDIFNILMKQKMRRDKERVCDHFLKTFPGLTDHYTLYRISDNAMKYLSQKTYNKGEVLIYQGDKYLKNIPLPDTNEDMRKTKMETSMISTRRGLAAGRLRGQALHALRGIGADIKENRVQGPVWAETKQDGDSDGHRIWRPGGRGRHLVQRKTLGVYGNRGLALSNLLRNLKRRLHQGLRQTGEFGAQNARLEV